MDVLEAREAALRRQLLGSSPTAPTTAPTTAAQASLADRIKDVNARLEELNNSISGFAKLVDLCACTWQWPLRTLYPKQIN